jgi:hypothetical protein
MINTNMSVSIRRVGVEQLPVIVIDDFASEPELLKQDASSLKFQPSGPNYPGIRAAVPLAVAAQFLGGLKQLVASTFASCDTLEIVDAYYSLVTTPPGQLVPMQCFPHFDGVETNRIALLHFLGSGDQGGTAFFRHRTTGFEAVTADRLAHYSQALQRDVGHHGLPPAGYISGTTEIFEEMAEVEAQFNRAIIYHGNALHCASIPPGFQFSADPTIGRLTVNTFLKGRNIITSSLSPSL